GPAATLAVSPSGAGDFRTVTEAIRKAPPGSRILVRPGSYAEGIVLEKPLEIVGDGAREKIVFANPDTHCVLIQTDRALVSGLTLSSQGACKGNQRSAVHIQRGQVVVDDCELSSDTLAAICVHGHATNPIIRGCRLSGSKGFGIQVADDARATIEDCEFF